MFCGSREISEPGRKLLVQWSNKAGAKQGIHKLRRGHRGGNVLHRAIPCCTRFLCGSSAALARDSRSEEHTSELQSLMRISYAVFCLKTKKTTNHNNAKRQ